jgi:hypothetical protein
MDQEQEYSDYWYDYTTGDAYGIEEDPEKLMAHGKAILVLCAIQRKGQAFFEHNTIVKIIKAYEALWTFAHKERYKEAAEIQKAITTFKSNFIEFL